MKNILITIALIMIGLAIYAQKPKLIVQDIQDKRIVKLKAGKRIGLITNIDTIHFNIYKAEFYSKANKLNTRQQIWNISSINKKDSSISVIAKGTGKIKSYHIEDIYFITFPRRHDGKFNILYGLIGATGLIDGTIRYFNNKRDLTTLGIFTIGLGFATYLSTTVPWLNIRKHRIIRIE